ncbi:MAG TPA: tripartite tricarboxylate transporter permease [Beijerinckiaceae bacterium]|nr:tripartite tricarboxylate transporter permease [Beijerinckiaceae bacterium]
MMESIYTALVSLFAGWNILYLLLGVLIGLVVGILPALGTTAGMALLVPFVFGMDQTAALAMMTGLLAVVATGDTVTSILLGIPGASSSQATVVDGFQMAKRGEAARALSAAYFSSLIGGIFGAVVLTGAIVIARPIILAFGTPEMLMLVVLGITMVSLLSGASLLKGFIALGLGMLLGAVGPAPATGEYRYTFDNGYVMDGLPLGVIALAVFAIPEIIDLLRRGEAISDRAPLGRGWLTGVVDTWRNRWLVLRCSVIGCIVGALPIGGSDWIAYGHAVQSSKPRDTFGKGDVRGVIAPEAANNANAGGALVPALIFGIPGSGSTAVFLGGLILIGVQPGPSMMDRYLDLTYTIIWSLALANVFGAGLCFLISGQMAKITEIKFIYLAPYILTVVFFGAFQSTRQWGDIVALFAVGVLGVFLRRFGYSRPAFLIGFVLQDNIETLLYQTVQFYTWSSLAARPIFWVLLLINVVSLWFGLKHRPTLETEGIALTATKRSQAAAQIVFLAVCTAVVVFCIYDVRELNFLGKVTPLTVAYITLACSLLGLAVLLARDLSHPFFFDSELGWREREEGYKVDLYHYLAWIAGLMLAMYLVGFVLAIALFFVVFLKTKSDARWSSIALMTGATLGVLSALSYAFVLEFPSGLLQDIVPLPWPFN